MDISSILNTLAERKNLDDKKASDLLRLIMDGTLTPSQTAAILMGLKMKGESAEEIAAFAQVMREKATDISVPELDLIDTCGTGGDGAHTFNISTISAVIACSAGCAVAKHGNRSISSRCGSADVLQALGLVLELPPEKLQHILQKLRIVFLFAPCLHRAMKFVMPVRKDLGIRTVFNILGPLTNPAGAKKQMIGVFNEKLCHLYADVLLRMNHDEAYIVHGRDGLDEVSICAPTLVIHLKEGKLLQSEVTPEEFGITRVSIEAIRGGDPEENSRIIRSILGGEKGPRRDIACLNAAFAIQMGLQTPSLIDAYHLAQESIDSGKAKAILSQWIEESKK
ncbi:MAG: anthranilate phosphoribosyltransferase [Candidatus Aureabacteria bacterium]|nr:anthranilate phosphoribosyltransferase [Candidatus Auribacterota bacterium]